MRGMGLYLGDYDPLVIVGFLIVLGFLVWVARNRRPDYGHRDEGPPDWTP